MKKLIGWLIVFAVLGGWWAWQKYPNKIAFWKGAPPSGASAKPSRPTTATVTARDINFTVIGGVAGLIASNGLVKILAEISPTDNTPVITVEAMLLAFSFSVAIGILAGLFPAFKAAKLNPIQALRYE